VLPVDKGILPADKMKTCNCKDKRGKAKNLYPSEYEAQDQIDYILEERGKQLKMYPCPECEGFHLTSRLEFSEDYE